MHSQALLKLGTIMRAVLVPRSTINLKSRAAAIVTAVTGAEPGAELRRRKFPKPFPRQHRSLASSPAHELVLSSKCIHREGTERKPQPRPAQCMLSKQDGHSELEDTLADTAPQDSAGLSQYDNQVDKTRKDYELVLAEKKAFSQLPSEYPWGWAETVSTMVVYFCLLHIPLGYGANPYIARVVGDGPSGLQLRVGTAR